MVGQKQVSVFGHVEATGGMGKADPPVGESGGLSGTRRSERAPRGEERFSLTG